MKRYEEKPFFPMFIDLSKKKVVVIGGGRIAGRRIRTLLSFAGQICVIAPEVTEEIDIQELVQILARYRSRAALETAGPYQMEDVTAEINGSCAGRPFHIVLGESCFQYEHAGGKRRTVLHGDKLLEEISEKIF